MTSHTGVTLQAAVAVIALSCLASPAHSSPLHPSLPALEQELDSLKPQPPPQDVSNQNVVHNPGDHFPPPSHMHDEVLQDVLRNDQDVNEKESSSPTRGPPLQDSSDAKQADVSPDFVAKLPGDPSAATENVNIPFGSVAGITGELEAGVASPSPALKEADQYGKDEEEEWEVLNGDSQKPQAQKTNLDEKDGQDGHPQEQKTPASDAEGTDVEDVGGPGEGNHGRQQQDSGFQFRDTEEEELRSLQAENKDDDKEEEEEEEKETNSKELSLPEIKDQNQNEAAAQELNSMIRPSWKESYHADDMYNGYDDNDDDDDDYDEADYWRKIAADDNPHETYPEEPSRESSYPDSVWRLVDVEETPSYDVGAAMTPEQLERGAWHEDVKREEEEEEQEDARLWPARVIVLNETLYLNSTEEDQLPKFRPVPMPDRFEDYDVNRDGVISLPELRYVSRATEGARQAFRDADLDGDGWVDQVEFQKAGWWVQADFAPSPPPPPPQDTPLPPSSSRRGNRVARTRD